MVKKDSTSLFYATLFTLDSGIVVGQGINVGSRKFARKINVGP